MIKLNLPVLFAQKGIRVADADRLTDMGRTTLYRLYNNEVTRIDFASLERLCKLLDCTPGDIILYEDDGQTDSQKKSQLINWLAL